MFTTWVPLGSVPRSLGGLAVRPGSQHSSRVRNLPLHRLERGPGQQPTSNPATCWCSIASPPMRACQTTSSACESPRSSAGNSPTNQCRDGRHRSPGPGNRISNVSHTVLVAICPAPSLTVRRRWRGRTANGAASTLTLRLISRMTSGRHYKRPPSPLVTSQAPRTAKTMAKKLRPLRASQSLTADSLGTVSNPGPASTAGWGLQWL